MTIPTVETHVLTNCGCVREDFVMHKLPYAIWGNDYLVYWNEGQNAAYYSTLHKQFCSLDGCRGYNLKFVEKPKDTPWTAKDAVKYLGHVFLNPGATHGCTICKIDSNGIYDKVGYFHTYDYLMKYKAFMMVDGVRVDCYNKG